MDKELTIDNTVKLIRSNKLLVILNFLLFCSFALIYDRALEKKYDLLIKYSQIIDSNLIEQVIINRINYTGKVNTSEREISFFNIKEVNYQNYLKIITSLNEDIVPELKRLTNLHLSTYELSVGYLEDIKKKNESFIINDLDGLNKIFESFFISNAINENIQLIEIKQIQKNINQKSSTQNIIIFFFICWLITSVIFIIFLEFRKKIKKLIT